MKRHTTGAYMASAAEKRPKRSGPSAPWRSRQLCQSDWMRSISSSTSAGQVRGAKTLRTFMERFWRSAGKPECISAQTDRAVARDRVGRPTPGERMRFREIFEDRKGIPDAGLPLDQHGNLPGWRVPQQPLL